MTSIDDIVTGVMQREDRRYVPGMASIGALLEDQPFDKGGPTLIGATWRRFGAWRFGHPVSRQQGIVALQEASEADLRGFYEALYVLPWAFAHEPLKILLIDWGVTTNQTKVVRALQLALAARGVYDGRIDGIAGPQTRAACLTDPDPRATYRDVFCARVRFYVELAVNDHTQLTFLRGWTARALEFAL